MNRLNAGFKLFGKHVLSTTLRHKRQEKAAVTR